jgi:hypothetical protein
VSRGNEDKLWWVFSKKGLFKVKSSFYSLACSGSSRFPWSRVWRTQAPSRAAFLLWFAALGKILTLDNLKKRHVIMINKCYMCKKTGIPWIIFFFTAMWLLLCGVLFSVVLGCLGLCPDRLSTCLLVSGHLKGQRALWFGKRCLFASFGAYGGKETI